MYFKTIKSDGLAHLSYMVGVDGHCAVIDPRRDVEVYLEEAREHGLSITHILETHIHADFVCGSRELASRTGATVCAGKIRNEKQGSYGFDVETLDDGDELEVGALCFRAVLTPGHSSEHMCYVLSGGGDGAEHAWAVFTGDLLFAGEVGRPDLEPGADHEELAGKLFDSIDRIMELDDGIEVYPCHGEGSPCGAAIGARDRTTIGYERQYNERVNLDDRARFVTKLMEELEASPAPEYYRRMKRINREGPELLGVRSATAFIEPNELDEARKAAGVVVLDAREIASFAGGHVHGSLNIALRGSFPVWAGRMLEPADTIFLVADDADAVAEIGTHLCRIGLEIEAVLRGGYAAWVEAGLPFEKLGEISATELHDRIEADDGLQIVDVREPAEFKSGHIAGAQHIFVPNLRDRLGRLDRERPVVTYCGSGYRASIAASMLAADGFDDVCNFPGSVEAWCSAGYSLTTD